MSERGESAVIVPVPAVEPLVSRWRERFDSSAAQGVPAHITALVPFLHERRLTDDVLVDLRAICSELDPFEVSFLRIARFPGVLWLDPEPAERLRGLTLAIANQWPEAPPYAGQFEDVVPHLTVACAEDAILDAVEVAIAPGLPLTTALAAARLYVFDGATWQVEAELPFQGTRSAG